MTKVIAQAAEINETENKEIATQMTNLEADVDTNLTAGSIKKAMEKAGAKSRDLWQVEPSKLRVIKDLNPRVKTPKYIQHIRELANSMKEEGFYQDKPLAGYVAVVDGEQIIYIYEGGSRLEASLLAISEGAEFAKVPVSVKQEGVNLEDILVAMVRGNTGRPLTPYETGVICKRLVKMDMEVSEIAKRLGITEQYANGLLSLMAAPLKIREMVATEVMAASFAIDMLASHGEKALDKVLEAQDRATSQGKTRVTKKHVTGAAFAKAVKKSAAPMFEVLAEVKADPAFASLSAEVQQKLADLVATLEKTKEAEANAEQAPAQGADESVDVAPTVETVEAE